MSATKRRILIVSLILIALIAGYFLGGKNLIYPPRASEALTVYNIISRGSDGFEGEKLYMPSRTVRWKILPVEIYYQADLPFFREAINDWNQAMGREVFKIGGQDSPVVIEIDSDISLVGKSTYRYSDYLLNEARIVLNPHAGNNKDILKDHLGHILGFFGHTTDDPNGVMDIDHTKSGTIISPFVVSVMEELYKLPPGTRGSVNFSLMQELKKYNVDSRPVQYFFETAKSVEEYEQFGKLPEPQIPSETIRWRSLPVAVYDKDNLVPDLQEIINDWNQAMGREVFKIGGADSPIVISGDSTRPPVELVVWIPKKNGLLDKVFITNNPSWIDSDKIKHQLGHALGFFGHTTDDPEGIMDPDYDKGKNISPLVVSVLRELYKIPPATEITDYFGRSSQEALAARQAVKKYNIDPRGGDKLPEIVRTVRWRSLPVAVYNEANISGLQGILDEWNRGMGQDVFVIGGPDSPITIEADSGDTPYSEFNAKTEHYLLSEFKLKVNSQIPNLHFLKHQLGHALGFFGHTTADPNGVMDKDHTKSDTVISSFVISVLKELYYLPPATLINY